MAEHTIRDGCSREAVTLQGHLRGFYLICRDRNVRYDDRITGFAHNIRGFPVMLFFGDYMNEGHIYIAKTLFDILYPADGCTEPLF